MRLDARFDDARHTAISQAADNATPATDALRLVDRSEERLAGLQVRVLLPGVQEGASSMCREALPGALMQQCDARS